MKNILQSKYNSINVPKDRSIADLFLRQVEKNPQALAVSDDRKALNYEQLAGLAGDLAHDIIRKIGTSDVRVCILAPQSVSAVIAMLGVLKAGKCLVPMLPQESDDYLQYLWKNSEASLIVCDQEDAERAAAICGDPNVVVTVPRSTAIAKTSGSFGSSDPRRVCAILYTSGSMGQPKGVMRTEQGIIETALSNIETKSITSTDRIVTVVPWQFAAAQPIIFASLLAGAMLFLYDNHLLGIERVGLWIKKNLITITDLPAALVSRFIERASSDLLTSLRLVNIGGGALTVKDARILLDLLPENAALISSFGSTETYRVTFKEWRRPDPVFTDEIAPTILPAGYPLRGKKIEILNDDGVPVPTGEEGELVVVSRHMFTGYWKEQQMTAQCLKEFADGEYAYYTGDLGRICRDGCLEIVGRKGHRVKIRGLRIDLEAVESFLCSLSYVRDAAAVSFSAIGREAQLVAYLETTSSSPTTATQLREDLKQIAPGYMIPSRFVVMESLPRTANGKIDRKTLPAPGRQRPVLADKYVPPRNDLEKLLADIWAEVLEIDEIGIHDDFLELGGDSLLALRLLLEIENRTGKEISAADFFQQSTVELMASVLQRQDIKDHDIKTFNPLMLKFKQLLASKTIAQSTKSGVIKTKAIKHSLIRKIADIIYMGIFSFQIWIYGQKWAQKVFYTESVILIKKFYQTIENPMQSLKETIQCGLTLNNFGKIKKQLSNDNCSYNQGRWAIETDMTSLKVAYNRGKGIILAGWHIGFHNLIEKLVIKLLKTNSYMMIKGVRLENTLSEQEKIRIRLHILLDQLLKAKSTLIHGGIVSIFPDGGGGISRSILLPFHGQIRGFRTGFAELALETGATIIPISIRVEIRKKKIEISSLEPMDMGSVDMNHADRVELLVEQYADYLRKEWACYPGNVPLRQMRRHILNRYG